MTANNHHRRTRIVATLGPASSTPEQIVNLAKAGVNVFRLNFSHGTHDEHAARHKAVREAEAKVGHPLAVLADFQGPKLRVGVFENGPVVLKKGQKFGLDLDKTPGNEKRVNLPHPEIISAIDVGHRLLLDDGKMALKVLSKNKNGLETEVLVGGKLSERKGVNVPDVALPIPALTEKDHKDFKFALSLGVDIVALSFVQKPEDIQEARDIAKGQAWIVTKLEKPQAVEQLEEIIRLSDALMVARGDLGVELPAEDVPVVQKRAIKEARRQGRPVIVATQMLESMIDSPSPTRAEVSDVANAVYDGADAVMLSAESAAGGYGLDAVSIMARTVSRVERDADWRARMDNMRPVAERSIQGSQAKSAGDVARHAGASALAVQTEDGRSAVLVSRERPHQPIVALTNETTARRLSVVWGVFAKATSDKSEIASSPVVKSGDHVVLLDSSKALSVVKV
ncbi:pyruvate kinase [Saccharibacter floricola]|uniref:Pyruvate kinase n=1 Tax=Saccharibacter floricola DSM 15669 TaxID=1123227 RepID=A0ABQ0P026_9PROT|nr:pyruvate kinase [Saccharibacter floricola]GBQ07649.1 pyruvate kinase [Saccharibacter floricola DSM 15669]